MRRLSNGADACNEVLETSPGTEHGDESQTGEGAGYDEPGGASRADA